MFSRLIRRCERPTSVKVLALQDLCELLIISIMFSNHLLLELSGMEAHTRTQISNHPFTFAVKLRTKVVMTVRVKNVSIVRDIRPLEEDAMSDMLRNGSRQSDDSGV